MGGEDPIEEGMATHSSILAERIPWTEEPGGLQSIGVARSRTLLKQLTAGVHARTYTHTHTHTHPRLGPALITSFCLSHLFKDVTSKRSHILSTDGVRALTQDCKGDTVQPTSAIFLFNFTAPISTPSFSSEMITLCCDGLDISLSL